MWSERSYVIWYRKTQSGLLKGPLRQKDPDNVDWISYFWFLGLTSAHIPLSRDSLDSTLVIVQYSQKISRMMSSSWYKMRRKRRLVKILFGQGEVSLSLCSLVPWASSSPSVQFNFSVMSDSLWPHGLQPTRPPCPSSTPTVYSNSCPLSPWCHPIISSSVVPFSACLQSFPASGSFQMSQLFASGGQSIGVSASTWVLPMNIQDWFH